MEKREKMRVCDELHCLRESRFPVYELDALEDGRNEVRALIGTRPVLIVADERYNGLGNGRLTEQLLAFFQDNRPDVLLIDPVKDGGENKGPENLQRILDELTRLRFPRDGVIAAVGGGVILDLAGFAAMQYRRMTDYLRIPTTLIGQIDAGIGIKVGVNYSGHKNLLGGYYAPLAVFNSREYLRDLSPPDFRCGMAEILKVAVIQEKTLLDLLDAGPELGPRSPESIQGDRFRRIKALAISSMIGQLELNPFERGDLRRKMDFGHMFSPVYEAASGYRIPHGFAVAVDMIICIGISRQLHLLDEGVYSRYMNLFRRYRLAEWMHAFAFEEEALFREAVSQAKAHRAGNLNLPLPAGEGDGVFVNLIGCPDLSPSEYSLILEEDRLLALYAAAIEMAQCFS